MVLTRRGRVLLAVIGFLALALIGSLMIGVVDFLALAATYTVLDWWFPQILGQVTENPLTWALWIALANAAVLGVAGSWTASGRLRNHLAGDYPLGDFLAGKVAIVGRHVAPGNGRGQVASLVRTFLLTATVALLVLVYIGNFPFDGHTLRLTAISGLAIALPGGLLWILRGAFPRREDPEFDIQAEFHRQLENLHKHDYPRHAGLTPNELTRRIEPLKDLIMGRDEVVQRVHKLGRIPFVIVIRQELVSADAAIRLVKHRGNTGFSVIDPDELRRLEPIPTVAVPDDAAYLLIDIDLGRETRNVTADDAQKQIEAHGRSPLTVEEGVALITHHPGILATNAWFSLPGSRRGESQITSIRISKDRPKLGWWPAARPNSWLGCPSCYKRLGLTHRIERDQLTL